MVLQKCPPLSLLIKDWELVKTIRELIQIISNIVFTNSLILYINTAYNHLVRIKQDRRP